MNSHQNIVYRQGVEEEDRQALHSALKEKLDEPKVAMIGKKVNFTPIS